jgi:hypothetical protein
VLHYVDVAVVDPAATSHLRDADFPSDTSAGGAARQEEDRKKFTYRNTEFAGSLFPFVMESTGRLGGAAVDYLERFGNHVPSRRSALLADLSSILAKLGEMCSHLRQLIARGAVRGR